MKTVDAYSIYQIDKEIEKIKKQNDFDYDKLRLESYALVSSIADKILMNKKHSH